ncbi:MAG TPA: 3-isopropylmalate dehydratase small subunit [Frankiaceae bacterium]|jgi:3-isopropylmalate/(R)-2-methylmalate dehydratase small subunit|nr:3-isopropylmalate dehydratase small subunit [Frankiaceae bacterium]
MEAFTTHVGRMVPLRRSNVDTDQIIPASFLKRVSRDGYGDALFAAWRDDPAFVLNDPRYAGATVLVAGPDFGTGSSREHAVWALRDYGFRAVVSSRFADIFRGNALNAGLLPVEVPQDVVEALWERDDEVTLDLRERLLTCGAIAAHFPVSDHARRRLLEGLDAVDLTLTYEADIAAYEARREEWLPRV